MSSSRNSERTLEKNNSHIIKEKTVWEELKRVSISSNISIPDRHVRI